MMKLNTLVLIHSLNEQIVIPNTSPWFQFYKVGSNSEVVTLNNTEQYKGDWLGLKTLDMAGKLKLFSTECPHQDMGKQQCKQYYLEHTKPFLNNTLPNKIQM